MLCTTQRRMKKILIMSPDLPLSPDKNCRLCPRLAAFLDKNRALYPSFWNAPVPSFGNLNAELLIVGLAPGLKGANRTGRPFTGDFAGNLLYGMLIEFGYATGEYKASPDDGVVLTNARLTNAVRCVPPENKVTGSETNTCNRFLKSEINSMPNLKAVLALGTVSHGAVLSAFGEKKSAFKFAHAAVHDLTFKGRPVKLVDSYHSSRYNVNTGKLTPEMFKEMFTTLDSVIKSMR